MTSWLGRILLGLLISIIFYESDKWIFEVKKDKVYQGRHNYKNSRFRNLYKKVIYFLSCMTTLAFIAFFIFCLYGCVNLYFYHHGREGFFIPLAVFFLTLLVYFSWRLFRLGKLWSYFWDRQNYD